MIEVQCFQRMMSADPVTRSFSREFSSKHRFLFRETTGFVGGDDKRVVSFTGDGQKFGHDWYGVD
jgi:hypothetical protein